jgi:Cd2+/Zn2+-exporting ATPase
MTDRTHTRGGEVEELVLAVPDMDCASCARRISDRLEGLTGVEHVEPRILTKDVRVRFDPAQAGRGSIADAIRSLGYTIEHGVEGERDQRREERSLWRGAEAVRTYFSGLAIGLGLILRVLGLSPSLASPLWWTIDAAALLFISAALIGGLNFFPKGLRAARIVRLDMNFLMTVAIFGAMGIGEFVEAGTIAFLFSIAELLERYSVARARHSIEALLDLAPAMARVRRNGEWVTVPVDRVEVGDTLQVFPGEKVPIDGEVTEGASAIDESPITGESIPVSKSVSDYVYAGSLNREGYIEVHAAKRAGDTTLAHIIHLVEEAEATRSPSERFVDRFARLYTPSVTVLAVIVMVVPPLLLGAAFSTWFLRGLTLLVISCPCALVISTPVAVISGITSAARNGVLIKGGAHLEALADIRVVAFDKTGTLTRGELGIVDVVTDGEHGLSPSEIVSIAAALEARSEHPIAEAILRDAREREIRADGSVHDFESLPGRGVQGRLNGELFRVGRAELFPEIGDDWASRVRAVAAAGNTAVCVGDERRVLGVLAIADRERESARDTIAELRGLGIRRIVMLTGDHEATARAIAERLDVDEYHAGLLPEEKVALVERLEAESGAVAMIGDGVNDAPALAAATVGIAMGAAGSDVALETADVALMSDDLSALPYLFRISRRGERVIRENIGLSILLKLSLAAGVPLGWVSLITAVLVGDMGASLAVTGNALRLTRLRR